MTDTAIRSSERRHLMINSTDLRALAAIVLLITDGMLLVVSHDGGPLLFVAALICGGIGGGLIGSLIDCAKGDT